MTYFTPNAGSNVFKIQPQLPDTAVSYNQPFVGSWIHKLKTTTTRRCGKLTQARRKIPYFPSSSNPSRSRRVRPREDSRLFVESRVEDSVSRSRHTCRSRPWRWVRRWQYSVCRSAVAAGGGWVKNAMTQLMKKQKIIFSCARTFLNSTFTQ